ncbi:Na/Pi cotransporter family protein [bacterium]|nr:Na/Pi cotransporter family protein [bacterium]
MTFAESMMMMLTALGGIGLFIFGMDLMTESLQQSLGHHLRTALQKLTAHPILGIIGGTAIATAIHSGPTTVMIVGFINAGLINLQQSIAVMLGANVGTSVSMQLVAFDLVAYAPIAIAIGAVIRMFVKSEQIKHAGTVLLGFGLLFVGLGLMKDALAPLKHSEFFQTLLSQIDGQVLFGMILGILISTVITGVLMSSGATVAIAYALADAGVITSISQAFPIVLGAHIGTTFITLLGAIGTNVNARRAAVSHLAFNVLGAILAAAMSPIYFKIIPMTSDSLVRQIANVHTFVQVFNSLVVLPMTGPFSKLIMLMVPSKEVPDETSHLDPSLVRTPELAILASIQEMRRKMRICGRMLDKAMEATVSLDLGEFESVRKDEAAVDQIKHALDDFFVLIASRKLSKRQSVLLQHLISSSNDVERIADHIETISVLTRAKVKREIWFDDDSMNRLIELGALVSEMLKVAVESLDPTQEQFREHAEKLLVMRKDYKRRVSKLKEEFNSRIFEGSEDAINGMFFMRYLTVFDRVIRHIRGLARAELQPTFYIKTHKLDRIAQPAEPIRKPPEDRDQPRKTGTTGTSQS